MTLRSRLMWRGQPRRLIHDVVDDLNSMLHFDAKHPTWGYLTTADHANIASLLLSLGDKLLAKSLA